MTPMIDVVFLLIIFFLVSSHLSRRETRMPVSLANSATGMADATADQTPLTITLNAQLQLFVGGSQLTQETLALRLPELILPNQPVRLRVDQTIAYEHLQKVLAVLVKAGVSDVAIVTNPTLDGSP